MEKIKGGERARRSVRIPVKCDDEKKEKFQPFVNEYYRDHEVFQDPRKRVLDPKLLGKLDAFLEDVGTNPNDIDFTDSFWCKQKRNRVFYEPKLPFNDSMVRVSDSKLTMKTKNKLARENWGIVKIETSYEMAEKTKSIVVKTEIQDEMFGITIPIVVKTEIQDEMFGITIPIVVKTEIPGVQTEILGLVLKTETPDEQAEDIKSIVVKTEIPDEQTDDIKSIVVKTEIPDEQAEDIKSIVVKTEIPDKQTEDIKSIVKTEIPDELAEEA